MDSISPRYPLPPPAPEIMTPKTPSDSSEKSNTSSGIPTPPSSVSSITSHHNEPRTSPANTQGKRSEDPLGNLLGLGFLALVVYFMAKSGPPSSVIGLAMYILVGVPAVCAVIIGLQEIFKLFETKSIKPVPTPAETTYDRLQILNTQLGELCLKMEQSAETIDTQLQQHLEQFGELSARLMASKEEQPVSSDDTEVPPEKTDEPSVHSPQPSIANGNDEDEHWQHWDHSVPWHGESYMIIEKSTLRAINSYGDIWLEDGEPKGEVTPAPCFRNTWLCIEEDNEFMFFNKGTCRYLGCLDEDSEPAPIEEAMLTGEEAGTCSFTARAHPRGGYELFLHSRNNNLRAVAVQQDNSHLHVRSHGPTLWEFRKVPSS